MSYRCQHHHSHMMLEYHKSVVTVSCSGGEAAVVVAMSWSYSVMVVVLRSCGIRVVTLQPCSITMDTSQLYSMVVVASGHVV